MCTAISVTVGDTYFGRNLDYEHNFGEKITITPRNYSFTFRNGKNVRSHYAIIGMALPYNGYPLYFDGTNEAGLSIAGLNFPFYAKYNDKAYGMENICSFEFIPYILSECKSVSEAKECLKNINITNEAFSSDVKPTQLHWIIGDRYETITAEQTSDGLRVHKNPVGVLTNSPTFDIQMFNLNNYMSLSADEPKNNFTDKTELISYSRGMGAMGLPGDLSSMSRFVKASFTKLNSLYGDTEKEKVSQLFHILYSVYQQRGCVRIGDNYEITNYTSCCNATKGIYYYTTYNNSKINAVDMHSEKLDGSELIIYDLLENEGIFIQNKFPKRQR